MSANPTATTRSWSIDTVPPQSSTFKPTAHLVIDSTKTDPYLLQEIEAMLYGSLNDDPYLPSQAEIIDVFENLITEPLSEPI